MRQLVLTLASLALAAVGVAFDPGDDASAGEPPKVMIFGDSMAIGLFNYMNGNPDYAGYELIDSADGACNIGRGLILTYSRQVITSGVCDDWQTRWPQEIAQQDPDVAILITGGWDITDRYKQQPSQCSPGPWCPPPPFRISQEKGDERYAKKLELAIQTLGAGGAHVIVASEPYVNPKRPTPESGPIQNVHWEPYPDTKPGPTAAWPDGWKRPTKGASYISSRIKIDALIAQQDAVISNEFPGNPKVERFSFLDPLSPNGNQYARKICPPPYAPGDSPCSVEVVLVRASDGYHLQPAGNQIVADELDARLREILELPV